jgi:3,4-dihydroxy 2-butanone 4-phosphate synthase/GTP cyclohydrolase II
VLVRAGHTEALVDLCRIAGLSPVAAGIEIMRPDGEMARQPDLETFCKKHELRMCSVADLIRYRMSRETLVKRLETITLPTRWGTFTLHAYERSASAPGPVQGGHRRTGCRREGEGVARPGDCPRP